jgi:DNA end-binding protein Ku
MRSIWTGSITFGMVSIPAKLYTATDDRKVPLHQYHAECESRIKMPKVCPKCDGSKKVADILERDFAAEIRRGYEISEDRHAILEDTDFQSLPLKSLKQIEVVEFADHTRIDVRAYDACYFLSCEDAGTKAFTLFLKAMETANLVAIAKLAYREREHLSAIRPYGGVMLLQTLHYADELKPYEGIKPRHMALISDKEMEMAITLVKAMKAEFDLAKYHDEYREALEQVIEAKLEGKVITAPEEVKPPVEDVAAALIASLDLVGVKVK